MKKQRNSPAPFLQAVFIAAIAILPFVFHLRSAEPALTPRYLVIAAMLFVAALYLIFQQSSKKISLSFSFLRRPVFPALLLYAFWGAVSLVNAVNLAEGISELSRFFLLLAFLVIAVWLLVNDHRFIRRLSRAITISAAALSIVGICQYFFIAFNSISVNTFMDGTMFNKNLFTTALLLMAPFAANTILDTHKYWRICGITSLMLSGFIIGAAHTRSAWVGLAGAMIALMIFYLIFRTQFKALFSKLAGAKKKREFKDSKRVVFTIIAYLSIVLLSAVGESLYRADLLSEKDVSWKKFAEKNQLATRNYNPSQTVNIRFTLWRKTLKMIEDYPLFGVGLGNWKIIIPAYGTRGLDSATGKRNFIRPHNDYLWVLAETGIPGFLLYLSIFGIALFYAFRIFFDSREASARFMAVLMAFGLTEYLIFSTFTFSRERIIHSTFLMLMIAVLTALYHRSFPLKTEVTKFHSTPVLLMILLVAGVCAGIGYSRFNSEIHTFKAESPLIQNQPQAQLREFYRAETFLYKIDPVANPLSLRRGEAYLALNRLDDAFEDFLKAYRVHPNNILVLWNLAAMYDRRNDPEKSEEFFQKVLAISPQLEGALLNLTAVYIKMGKYEAAYEVIQRCHPESGNPKVAQYRRLIEQKLRE